MYRITGTLYNGRRFKAIYTDNLRYALGHNLWSGHIWERKPDGHWKIIKSYYN